MRNKNSLQCIPKHKQKIKSRRVKESRTKMKDQISNGQTMIHIDVLSECLIQNYHKCLKVKEKVYEISITI